MSRSLILCYDVSSNRPEVLDSLNRRWAGTPPVSTIRDSWHSQRGHPCDDCQMYYPLRTTWIACLRGVKHPTASYGASRLPEQGRLAEVSVAPQFTCPELFGDLWSCFLRDVCYHTLNFFSAHVAYGVKCSGPPIV